MTPKRSDGSLSGWQQLKNRLLFARSFAFESAIDPKYWHSTAYALDLNPQGCLPGSKSPRSIEVEILNSSDTVLLFEAKLVYEHKPGNKSSTVRADVRLDYDPFDEYTLVTGKVYFDPRPYIGQVIFTPFSLVAVSALILTADCGAKFMGIM